MPDRRALRRALDRVAAGPDCADGLSQETGDELLDRLDGIRVEPERIVDLGCGTGRGVRALMRRYRRAEVLGLDRVPAMLARTRQTGWLRRRPRVVCADMTRLPMADASVDLLYSNLAFAWIEDPALLFRELRRVLRPEGVLLFSTFGPDTLAELRTAWAAVDDHVHVGEFPDMHDLGDAMLAAGLRDPVMDVDRTSRASADITALLREVRAIGAGNVARARARGLTGRGRLRALADHYPRLNDAGRPLATWEIVYGHAWGATSARAGHGDAQQFHVPVDAIGRRRRDQVS